MTKSNHNWNLSSLYWLPSPSISWYWIPFNSPFPWLMTTAVIAALHITFIFGKMAFTDVHGMPPSLVHSATAATSPREYTETITA